ncbi:MAG TPA: plastocyanin/azurin family copper-binding protein [Blastocatellia bacterium]|nr:plastocyanin/azurin family copper-binding protein [Blastocatellia bacterium]
MSHLSHNYNNRSTVRAPRAAAGRIAVYSVLLSIVTVFLLMPRDGLLAHASQPAVVIKMVDMPPMFEPKVVTIKTGEAVEWQNIGNEVHHATSDPSMAIKTGEVSNPPATQPFDSGFLRPGETFTHVFSKPGTYKYACIVHEAKGMIGEVVVK